MREGSISVDLDKMAKVINSTSTHFYLIQKKTSSHWFGSRLKSYEVIEVKFGCQ